MKHLKMFATVAILAAALLASVGSGSALANKTTLCSTNTNPCTGTTYPVGTVIKSQLVGEAVFITGFATIKCKKVSGEGQLQEFTASGTPRGKITATPFGECGECTLTLTSYGTLEISTETSGTSNGNGTQTGSNTRLTANCSGISCIFGTAESTTLGKVTGGNPAIFKANAKVPYFSGDASNFVCTLGSGTGSMTAEMEVTAPKPLFIE